MPERPIVSNEHYYPMSAAQQALWFLQQLDPASPAYNETIILRLKGSLDSDALLRAFQEVVQRHEVLRTTFREVDGQIRQCVTAGMAVAVRTTDARGSATAHEQEAWIDLIRREARAPFDLQTGPLVRANLFKLALTDHLLVVIFHHTITDGESRHLFLRELSVLYGALAQGDQSPLPPQQMQYSEYTAWHNEWLQSEAVGEQVAYWRDRLLGLDASEIPTDRPRGDVLLYDGARVDSVIASATVERLKSDIGQHVSVFTVLLTALHVLVHRYSSSDDTAVATAVSGRDPRLPGSPVGLRDVMGLLVNTVIVRAGLGGDPSFREALGRIRESARGAYAHQHLPFGHVVANVHPDRDLASNPFSRVRIVQHAVEWYQPRFAGLGAERLDVSADTAKSDVTLYVSEDADEVRLTWEYFTDLFNRSTIERVALQYALLLDQVVADPDRPLGSYSLVLPEDRRLLPDPARDLNGPDYETVAALVRAEAARDRSAVAVVQGSEMLTYGELIDAVDALGEALTAGGSVRGETIALTGPRSFGLVVGMIAVMDVGAVLMLVDPDLPLHRRRLMLHEARASRLLTIEAEAADRSSDLADHVPLRLAASGSTGRPIGTWTGARPSPCENGEVPADAAYVFFTSGTTGVPKAVLGSGRSLSHFIAWQRRTFETGPHDRCAQLTALSFDPILRDVFLPLTSGGALCLPEEHDARDGTGAMEWLRRQRVTLLHMVPARAQSWLIDARGSDLLPELRWVFFAGEPLTDGLVRAWRAACGGTGIVNLYGPTETTLARCWFRVPDDPVPGIQPLGAAIDNSQALVLTDSGAMCGIGEPGQIAVRTAYGTYGYLNAPDEQARRFVPSPNTVDPTERLYLTGDLGRWRSDGTLAFMGRIDDQVKVRGVRVEPSGVAAALTRHAGVRSAFVVGRTDATGSTELVAYVVAGAPGSATPAMLRAHLRSLLPSAAVPSLYVFMDRLPMTPNGKVDRAALPAPEPAPRAAGADPTAPRTPTEAVLAELWRDVLGTDRVGVHDGFFDLGGTSLSAARLFARIEARFGKRLPLALIFEAGDIAGLAEALEAQDDAMPWRSLVAIRPAVGLPPFFFVHGVRGNVVGCEALVRHLPAELPVYGLQAASLGSGETPYASIQDIARSYIEEVLQVCPAGPCFIGGYSFGGLVAYEMACQLAAQGREVPLLALFDRKAPGFTRLKPLSFRVMNHLRTILSLRGEARAQYLHARFEGIVHRGWFLRMRRALGASAVGPEPKYELMTAHSMAVAHYRLNPYAGRTVVFRAAVGLVHHEPEPTHGWRHLVTGPLIVREVPGDHSTMLAEPSVSVLARELETCIRDAIVGGRC